MLEVPNIEDSITLYWNEVTNACHKFMNKFIRWTKFCKQINYHNVICEQSFAWHKSVN